MTVPHIQVDPTNQMVLSVIMEERAMDQILDLTNTGIMDPTMDPILVSIQDSTKTRPTYRIQIIMPYLNRVTFFILLSPLGINLATDRIK